VNQAPNGARAFQASVLLLALIFLALHIPYLPASLEDLDSVNFALGVRDFDVAHHQPHPPGYPVFILLAKAARVVTASEASALALVSILAGALGVLAMGALFGRLDRDRGPSAWSTAAAGVAMTAPMYWFTAARPLSDVSGLAAALAVQAMTLYASTGRALAVAAFCAGLAAGLRSQVLWLTVPLLIVRAWALRQSPIPNPQSAINPQSEIRNPRFTATFPPSRIVATLFVAGKHVRQFRLIHLVHQRLNLLRPHRHTAEDTELQCGTDENHTQPARKGHDTPSACDSAPHPRIGTRTVSWGYASVRAGGARLASTASSETGCSSHRNASRRTTVTTTAGSTSQSGTRTAAPRVDARAGTNAAKTTSAMQTTAIALRL
jgi:hypothetical protein